MRTIMFAAVTLLAASAYAAEIDRAAAAMAGTARAAAEAMRAAASGRVRNMVRCASMIRS